MDPVKLQATAQALVGTTKGHLAMDESPGTVVERLNEIGVESNLKNRCAWRELLITAPGLSEWISGAILYDETIRQSSVSGTPFVQLLQQQGIIQGIKVDTGTKPLAQCPHETVTERLKPLRSEPVRTRGHPVPYQQWRLVKKIATNL